MNTFDTAHIKVDQNGYEHLIWNGIRKRISTILFAYQMPTFAALAAGANGQQQLNIDAGTDFLWTHGAMAFDLAAAAFTYLNQPIPNMSIQLSDSGESYNFQNASVPVMSLFGLPGRPTELPVPYLFAGGATITGLATNYDAATATGNLRLTFIGRKIRYLN